MMEQARNLVGAVVIAASVVMTPMAAPAAAAPVAVPDAQVQTGAVNVTVRDISTGDIISNNQVGIGVAAGIVANVCGLTVQVGVIARQIARDGTYTCTGTASGQSVEVNRR